jgi:hypothetical protein
MVADASGTGREFHKNARKIFGTCPSYRLPCIPPGRVVSESFTESLAPIFIIGVPRSGTTLLWVLLDTHSEIAGLPETHHRIGRVPASAVGIGALACGDRAAFAWRRDTPQMHRRRGDAHAGEFLVADDAAWFRAAILCVLDNPVGAAQDAAVARAAFPMPNTAFRPMWRVWQRS